VTIAKDGNHLTGNHVNLHFTD